MARMIVGGYLIRYPMGGALCNTLHILIGIKELGHDVYFIEKSGWENSCFDPETKVMSNDCRYGIKHLGELFSRFGLGKRWGYQDHQGKCHGLSRAKFDEILKSADLFIDYGSHGTWRDETTRIQRKVLIDGEPGMTQMRMAERLSRGEDLFAYDAYFTVGQNVGQEDCLVPAAGQTWQTIFHPISVHHITALPVRKETPFTTVMNWQSHQPVKYLDHVYGQKDVEFTKFMRLPQKVSVPCEVAVAGANIPRDILKQNGWRIRDAQALTLTYDAFLDYIYNSAGEFSVCKNIFVATNSGWFSDRSAAYLACGRPVVLQDTGFSRYLPCADGGLFAVKTPEEAAAALEEAAGNRAFHAKRAREIAGDCLDAKRVMAEFLRKVFS